MDCNKQVSLIHTYTQGKQGNLLNKLHLYAYTIWKKPEMHTIHILDEEVVKSTTKHKLTSGNLQQTKM